MEDLQFEGIDRYINISFIFIEIASLKTRREYCIRMINNKVGYFFISELSLFQLFLSNKCIEPIFRIITYNKISI